MKKVKQIEYEELMAEVVPLLRFNQGRAEVEARVEFLVKRGNLDIVDTPASDAAEGENAMQVDESKAKKIVKYAE